MSQQSRQFSAMGSCFPPLARYFQWQIRPRKLHFVPALQISRPPARLRGLDTQLAFDFLDKSQTADRKGF
jgi:hypothetical protein